MPFELFVSRTGPKNLDGPTVSVSATGYLYLNHPAAQMIGSSYVCLLWNQELLTFAIQPADETMPAARLFKNKKNFLYASAFLRHIGLSYLDGPYRFPATWNAAAGFLEVPIGPPDERDRRRLLGRRRRRGTTKAEHTEET